MGRHLFDSKYEIIFLVLGSVLVDIFLTQNFRKKPQNKKKKKKKNEKEKKKENNSKTFEQRLGIL